MARLARTHLVQRGLRPQRNELGEKFGRQLGVLDRWMTGPDKQAGLAVLHSSERDVSCGPPTSAPSALYSRTLGGVLMTMHAIVTAG